MFTAECTTSTPLAKIQLETKRPLKYSAGLGKGGIESWSAIFEVQSSTQRIQAPILFVYLPVEVPSMYSTLSYQSNTLHYLCDIHAHSRPIRHHRLVRANALFVLAHFRQCEVPSNSPQTIQELHHSSAWVLVGGRTLYWSRPLADCCLIMANFVILRAILHIWMKVQARLPMTACQ